MPLDLITIPCRQDNYAFLIHNSSTNETALIDAPEAAPIASVLSDKGWTLTDLVLTHHHDDHIAAVEDLRGTARVIGAAADAHRLPPLDLQVAPGTPLTVCGHAVTIFDTPGHTVGHISLYVPDAALLFSGDTLMAMGCGRLFEGTPDQMWHSLQTLRDLPGETLVCSGHEYTAANMAFALSLEPDNPRLMSRQEEIKRLRAAGQFTVPSALSLECRTNPFLRADDPALAQAIGQPQGTALEVFTKTRAAKDRF